MSGEQPGPLACPGTVNPMSRELRLSPTGGLQSCPGIALSRPCTLPIYRQFCPGSGPLTLPLSSPETRVLGCFLRNKILAKKTTLGACGHCCKLPAGKNHRGHSTICLRWGAGGRYKRVWQGAWAQVPPSRDSPALRQLLLPAMMMMMRSIGFILVLALAGATLSPALSKKVLTRQVQRGGQREVLSCCSIRGSWQGAIGPGRAVSGERKGLGPAPLQGSTRGHGGISETCAELLTARAGTLSS